MHVKKNATQEHLALGKKMYLIRLFSHPCHLTSTDTNSPRDRVWKPKSDACCVQKCGNTWKKNECQKMHRGIHTIIVGNVHRENVILIHRKRLRLPQNDHFFLSLTCFTVVGASWWEDVCRRRLCAYIFFRLCMQSSVCNVERVVMSQCVFYFHLFFYFSVIRMRNTWAR